MGMRKIYVFLMALFLMPFGHANVDLQELADQVREFTTQIQDPKVAATLKADADELEMHSDNPRQKIRIIENIIQELYGLKKKEDALSEQKIELIANLACGQLYLEEIPHEMLKQKAREYFLGKYPEAEIEFSDKDDGIQLGDCIHIHLLDGSEIVYHIKTHSHGLRFEIDSLDEEVEPVRLEELFVYKFLQYSGLGPKVHFFWHNEKDFYIATEDISCTANGKIEAYTYESVKSTPQLLGTNYLGFSPAQESFVNPKVIQSLVLIDITSRIFGLEDLITNTGNFYFICSAPYHISGFKIIDFHISNHGAPPTLWLFNGFLMGSGPYSYLSFTDTISRYFLAHRDKSARIEAARLFFLPMVPHFTSAIEQSFRDIQALKGKMTTLDETCFEKYHQSVVANMNAFAQALQSVP
jgi:hypothetical protein